MARRNFRNAPDESPTECQARTWGLKPPRLIKASEWGGICVERGGSDLVGIYAGTLGDLHRKAQGRGKNKYYGDLTDKGKLV